MKTVQMTLDEDLVKSVDKLVKELDTTRSEFTRTATASRFAVRQPETARTSDPMAPRFIRPSPSLRTTRRNT